MKRKILATVIASIAAVTCVAGLTACGGNDGDDGAPKKTALDRAYENYYKAENMKIQVTDSRTTKYGNDYSGLIEINHAERAAYTKTYSVYTDLNYKTATEYYYEIDSAAKNFILYSRNSIVEGDATTDDRWFMLDRSDLFREEDIANYETQDDFEIHLICNWVEWYLPTHYFLDTGWRAYENEAGAWVSPKEAATFTETSQGYSAGLYFCINNDGSYVPYACTVTIKLDSQERFKSCVVDFGQYGQITAEFTYGAATVTVPQSVKDSAIDTSLPPVSN